MCVCVREREREREREKERDVEFADSWVLHTLFFQKKESINHILTALSTLVFGQTVTLVEKRVTATEDRVAQMLRESGKENWQFKDVDGEGPDSSQSSGVREADRAALRDETFSAELERLSEIGDARVDEITDEELQEHIERLEQLQRSYASSKS